MNSQIKRVLSYIFRPTRLWLVLVAVSSIVGYSIVRVITHVDREKEESLQISAVYHGTVLAEVPEVNISLLASKAHDETYNAVLTMPIFKDHGVLITLSPLVQQNPCSAVYQLEGAEEVFETRTPEYKFPAHRTGSAVYSWDHSEIILKDPPANAKSLELLCSLGLKPNKLSFSQRRIRASAGMDPKPQKYPGYMIARIILDFPEQGNLGAFRITGGMPKSELKTVIDWEILIDWIDDERAQLRDAMLVLVGAFLGIAAAGVIELLRPAIERFR